jgi:cytoskeletal protein RodZ
MTAIGEKLKTTRESRGLTLDQVAAETNIARRYLDALENEDFSIFPGDAYIVGFLRNYSEYLGLDPQGMLQAFRGIRIQEQPVPIEKLLPSRKMPLWPLIVMGLALVAGLSAFLFITYVPINARADNVAIVQREPTEYSMESQTFERRLFKGDTVFIKSAQGSYRIALTAIHDQVVMDTPAGSIPFMLGEEASVDLDKTAKVSMRVFVSDFQKNDPAKGAMVRFSISPVSAEPASIVQTATAADPTKPAAATTAVGGQSTNPAPADRPATQESVIFSGRRSPHPFIVNVTFRNYAMFRHEIDRGEREERYYHRGDQITTTANNTAKIWTSNAGANKVTIQASGGASADLELGQPGEVAVKQIRWVQLEDGTWNLNVYNVN